MGKKAALFIIIAFLLVVGVMFFSARNAGQRVKIVREGDRAPEFRLTSLDGRSVALSDERGKVVLVHFWATWCPPCVEEMPAIERLYRAFIGKDFDVLAVSVDEGGAQAVGAFMKDNGLSLPVLLNPDRSVASLYGTFKFPETYVIDREGVVRFKAIGARDWSHPENMRAIQAMIDKK
jgi:peroxiredoxin